MTTQGIPDLDAAPPPRPVQGSRAGMAAITRAQHLACLVRDEGADTIGAYLDDLTPDQLYALVTALAAMVPVDATAADLLAWVAPPARGSEAA